MMSKSVTISSAASIMAKAGAEKRQQERKLLNIFKDFFAEYPDIQQIFADWCKREKIDLIIQGPYGFCQYDKNRFCQRHEGCQGCMLNPEAAKTMGKDLEDRYKKAVT